MSGYADISPVWLQDQLHQIADALTESGIRRWLHAQQSHRMRPAVHDDDHHQRDAADTGGLPTAVWLHSAILAVAAVVWLAELVVGNGWLACGRGANRLAAAI